MGKKLQKLRKRLNFKWYTRQSRNTKLAISLGGILLAVGLLSFLFTRSTEPAQVAEESVEEVTEIETADDMAVTISLIEGTLEYRTTEKDWDIATEEQMLEAGTKVRTVGAISRAVITLEDQSEIRVDANSQLELTNASTSRVIITHEDGYLYNRILPSTDRDYVVETENAQFESVGTAFRTISTGDQEAVEVYQGQVKEQISNQTVSSGERLNVEQNGQEINTNMEDIDINDLKENEFIEWNKERDLDNDLFKSSLGFLSDFDGPEIEITDPKPSSTITVESESEPSVVFKGKTEPNTKLTVESKSAGGGVKDVKVEGSGSFETPQLAGTLGNSVYEFIATDRRGNETKLNVTVTFSRQTTTQEQGVVLTGSLTEDSSVSLQWGLVGLTTPDGVRIVYSSTSTAPSYPTDDYIAVDAGESIIIDPSSGENTISESEAATYTFRVCRYLASSDTCDQYSNAVSVALPGDGGGIGDPTE